MLPHTTAHDVARVAGVSQSAVSRAFTPGSSISAVTRAKVIEAAQQIGYQPNAIARSLITRHSNIVGVAFGNLANPFFGETLQQLALQLRSAGLHPLLFTVAPEEFEVTVQDILQYRIEALVLLSIKLSSTLAADCKQARVPMLLYNRTTDDRSISSVTGDNASGGRAIASFLIAGRHERIAFMAGIDQSSTSREREDSFRNGLAEQGYHGLIREQGHFSAAGAAAAMRRLLLRPDRPDAVFCANDQMAITAIQVAQSEFGIEVGRDISIVGFDDVPMAAAPGISLTTYSQPVDAMVRESVSIIDALRKSPPQPRNVVVPGELIIRASTRRPPRARKETPR